MSANTSQTERAREHVLSVYRKRARNYDRIFWLYYLLGYPQRAHRRKAVQALGLSSGDIVVEIGCGTGLNFPLLEQAIGPEGRIVAVDLTDAMLAQAQRRVDAHGWGNISLVQADAVEFEFPNQVNAIISTFALSLVPECAEVIAHGGQALCPGGRWVVLDTKPPEGAPRWLAQGWLEFVRPFAGTDELLPARLWEAIRPAMNANLTEVSWTELFFGFAFLAAGTRAEA